jgi:hypothetical protein
MGQAKMIQDYIIKETKDLILNFQMMEDLEGEFTLPKMLLIR